MTASMPGSASGPCPRGMTMIGVPLLLDAEATSPRDRGWFMLGFEASMVATHVACIPDVDARFPIRRANKARVLAICNILRRRVTFEPLGDAGAAGHPTGWLVARVRPFGWTPGDDLIAESAGTAELDDGIMDGGGNGGLDDAD